MMAMMMMLMIRDWRPLRRWRVTIFCKLTGALYIGWCSFLHLNDIWEGYWKLILHQSWYEKGITVTTYLTKKKKIFKNRPKRNVHLFWHCVLVLSKGVDNLLTDFCKKGCFTIVVLILTLKVTICFPVSFWRLHRALKAHVLARRPILAQQIPVRFLKNPPKKNCNLKTRGGGKGFLNNIEKCNIGLSRLPFTLVCKHDDGWGFIWWQRWCWWQGNGDKTCRLTVQAGTEGDN